MSDLVHRHMGNDSWQFLVMHLQAAAGDLDNHADGSVPMTPQKAQRSVAHLEAVLEKLEALRAQHPEVFR